MRCKLTKVERSAEEFKKHQLVMNGLLLVQQVQKVHNIP